MAQSQSIAAFAAPSAQVLPMESFLATEDPVWVWDGRGRRIVWANAAAQRLWGDPNPDRLKRRRAGQSMNAPARLTELARSENELSDHVETLRIPAPGGPVAAPCVFQRLRLAEDRPGLLVRMMPARERNENTAAIALHPSAQETHDEQVKTPTQAPAQQDAGALEAIARDMKKAKSRHSKKQDQGSRTNIHEHPELKSRNRSGASAKAPSKSGKQEKPAAREAEPRKDPVSAPSGEEMAALLARVSHEIRNPLTIIIGFAEILQSDRIDRLPAGKAKEYASDIYRTAQLALGLADDLLGFAERASGEPPPPHDWMDLNAVIVDCLHLLEPLAAAQGVTLTRSLKREAPWLLAHERSMRQILLNLLMNALRHGDRGGKIRVMTRLDREGALIVSVKDDGPGMTPEQIAAAKSPEQTRDVKQAGRRGLGLRLVVGFVRDNQGELDIISKPGAGADVRIRFAPDRLRKPASKNARKSTKPANKAKQPANKTKQAAPNKRPPRKTQRKRA